MNAIIVQGRLVTPTQIELEQPVVLSDPHEEVEIRMSAANKRAALLEWLRRMALHPARGRTREDIDRQIQEERDRWE